MDTIKKRYIKVSNNPDVTHLKIEIYYQSKADSRGYYVLMHPVKRELKYGCTMETFIAYSGFKMRILQVARKFVKAEGQAVEWVRNNGNDLIKQYFGNLELTECNIKELI